MWSCPELLLISELLELLDSGHTPRAWDQLAREQSQLRCQSVLSQRLVHAGNGSREWQQGRPRPCAGCEGHMAVPGISFWAGNCSAWGSPAPLPAAVTSPGWQMLLGTSSLGCCKDGGGKQLFLHKESAHPLLSRVVPPICPGEKVFSRYQGVRSC